MDDEFVEASVFAFLSLHPSLAVEIERSIPIGASLAEQDLFRNQKGWAQICISAGRNGLDPLEFARQVIRLADDEKKSRH